MKYKIKIISNLERVIKIIIVMLLTLLSFMLGFGIWYIIGYFLSNEINPLMWPLYGKIIYLIMGSIASSSIGKEISEL